jgi:hypothetical protein
LRVIHISTLEIDVLLAKDADILNEMQKHKNYFEIVKI